MNQEYKELLSWNEKAKINPLFAIMSDPSFEEITAENITPEVLEKFYKRGELFYYNFFENELRFEDHHHKQNVLEWGCGMGRILSHFDSSKMNCFGVDISEKQIELLHKYFPGHEVPRTEIFIPNKRTVFEDEYFDFIYSYAVFQHIKSKADIFFIIQEIGRILKKGGTLKYQIRTFNALQNKYLRIPIKVFNGNNASILFFLRKVNVLYLPVLRIVKHDHWSGAGCYIPVQTYDKLLEQQSIQITKVEYTSYFEQHSVWITAIKK